MNIHFEATTDVKKFDKETLFAFLNACNGKHIHALKYDSCEPCKKVFDVQSLDEMFALYVQKSGLLLKGKNGFWINATSWDFQGIITWNGEIKVKNPKKTDEIITEIMDLYRTLNRNGQFLFGSIATEEEQDIKHKVVNERSYGWGGSSIYDFQKFFPGIYWCTMFGKSMVEGVGKEHFLNIPDVEYLDFPDETIAFRLNIPISDEHNEQKLKMQLAIAKHIGYDYFFDLYNKKHKPSYPPLLKKQMADLENDRETIMKYRAKLRS